MRFSSGDLAWREAKQRAARAAAADDRRVGD
jgi:hypothetical protein